MAGAKDIIKMIEKDNKRMREAGNNLAIAAMRVIRDYDGIHRLSLAVSAWSKAIADEGGRADTVERKKLEGEE